MHQVDIAGKKYSVRFSIRAIMTFEKAAGMPIGKLAVDSMTIEQMVLLCYAGLVDGGIKAKSKFKHDLDWLVDQVSDDPKIIEDVIKAFSKSQKKPKKKGISQS